MQHQPTGSPCCTVCGKAMFRTGVCTDCHRTTTSAAQKQEATSAFRGQMQAAGNHEVERLILPCEDPEEWSKVEAVLRRPLGAIDGLDAVLTEFSAETSKQTCRFFSKVPSLPEASKFDFHAFWTFGVPLMVEIALEMPVLFEGVKIPLLLHGQNRSVSLTRRQCACLLSHSFFGSITANARRVSKEKWAFRAAQLFFLEALPSALCFLNYFKVLGERCFPDSEVTFTRSGFVRDAPPWQWDANPTPLCHIELKHQGAIEDSPLECHADFANKFVGGG